MAVLWESAEAGRMDELRAGNLVLPMERRRAGLLGTGTVYRKENSLVELKDE